MNRRLRHAATLAVVLSPLAFGTVPAFAQEEEHAPSAEHGQAEGHEAASGEHEEHQEFNWSYGFLGEREGVSPSLAYRPKGMPAPFLANVINAALLFGIIVGFGRKPIAAALKKRKERIVAGMDEAARMKNEAAERLAEYEEKLHHIDQEIERIRREMREAAQAEQRRILAEAKERRERMERDAKLLVEQELKVAREILVRETAAAALKTAEELLAKQVSPGDQDRLATEYLELVQKAPIQTVGGAS